jgi:hypothetical protein
MQRYIRNFKSSPTEISGLCSVAGTRARVAFGVIKSSEYSLGDVLCFDSLASFKIYDGKFNTHETSPSTLEILPGTKLTHPLQIKVATPVDISYVIYYVKGVGYTDAPYGPDDETVKNTGELLKIHII